MKFSIIAFALGCAAAPASIDSARFYLQVINGTRSGQFLTTHYTSKNRFSSFGPITWTDDLKNATIWSYRANENGYDERYLNTADAIEAQLRREDDPADIQVSTGYISMDYQWPVVIGLDGWDSGSAVGNAHPNDTIFPKLKQWNGCGDHLQLSSNGSPKCIQRIQYIRVHS